MAKIFQRYLEASPTLTVSLPLAIDESEAKDFMISQEQQGDMLSDSKINTPIIFLIRSRYQTACCKSPECFIGISKLTCVSFLNISSASILTRVNSHLPLPILPSP